MTYKTMNFNNLGYMIIYKITNLINNKCYVGQTIRELNIRVDEHTKKIRCRALNSAIKKYGFNNFKVEILETIEKLDDLNTREQFWIKELNTLSPNGYNLTSGGDNGRIMSEETKSLLSNFMKGKTGESHPSFGHKKNEKFKQERSNYMSNRVILIETRLKMSNAKKGNTNRRKKYEIIKDNIIIIFDSLKLASEFIGCTSPNLIHLMKKKNGIHKNYQIRKL